MNTNPPTTPERDPLCERALRVIRDALDLYDTLAHTIELARWTVHQCNHTRAIPILPPHATLRTDDAI